MRVFITGASGWIGSAVVDELVDAGHDVVGLVRSDEKAAALRAKGATPLRGDLDDLDGLRAGADDSEAVIHLANKHDFAHPEISNRAERAAVQTIGDTLAGSGRTFMLASGAGQIVPGELLLESDRTPFHGPDAPRGGSENLALEFVDRGVRVVSVRFAPTVHGAGDHGFVATIAGVARAQGVSGYIGEGQNQWSAVHISDAARVVRGGLEQDVPGSVLHAIAEEQISNREIAEAIGTSLGVPAVAVDPERAGEHFGWIGMFFGMGLAASNEATRELLGWTPTGPTLAEDLAGGAYAG